MTSILPRNDALGLSGFFLCGTLALAACATLHRRVISPPLRSKTKRSCHPERRRREGSAWRAPRARRICLASAAGAKDLLGERRGREGSPLGPARAPADPSL